MSLSTVNQITSTVQFDNRDFSFTKTYGTMIQNRPYSRGYKNFELGLDTRDAFLYKALSATADDVGNIVYLNVRKYIDFVTNVDICKVKSLQSMLKLFGFNKTIFNCFDSFPRELLDLINVLSINKKQLMKAGVLKEDFLSSIVDPDGNFYTNDDQAVYYSKKKLNLRKYFANNTYTLSADSKCINTPAIQIAKLNGLYQCEGQSLSSYIDVEDYIDEDQFSSLSGSTVYRNSNSDYFILEQKNSFFDIYTDKFKKVMKLDVYQVDSNLTADGDLYHMQISSLTSWNSEFNLPVYDGDRQFIDFNLNSTVDIVIRNLDYTEDVQCISDEKYESYLSTLYSIFLRGQLLAKYNAAFYSDKRKLEYYVYPYLGKMYFDEDKDVARSVYSGFEEDNDNILSIKMYNHIPKSFNEQKIVDDIDVGADDLDNYTGAELSVLKIEMQRRAAPLNWKKIGVEASSSKLSQTRYSYYREKKVAEYASFIDSYYTSIKTNPDIYDFDSNYYVIDKQAQFFVINQNIDMHNIDPSIDIDGKGDNMISIVAQYLAKLTLYINKIRDKIKLQTQKNYMKGTNLLMIYIINEYLNEYASHNKKFFYGEADEDTMLSTVYKSLNGHQFANEDSEYTIEIDEFYDKTNYYNIKTDTSVSSLPQYADEVNDRYWELTSIEKPLVMQEDGLYYKLGTLQSFYLSALGLKNNLVSCSTDDAGKKLAEFLCTIYDLGANDTFIYSISGENYLSTLSTMTSKNILSDESQLSIFSTMLEDKQHAAQVYSRFINLSSSYSILNDQYLSDGKYKYPNAILSDQISNVVSAYIIVNLSNEYLSGVSAIYNKHIKAVNSLCNDIDTLMSEYNDFINGTYSFYYKKSGNKYCYSDYDVDAGIYQHNYFVENDQYDNESMSLYEHLYQLQQYSVEENIHNFALSDTLSYVSDRFNSIYSALNSEVNSKLVLSGFVDIKALTLDDELQYTYDYLKEYVDTRKQVLQNQLQSMQQQANALKLQYETLNNTFTNAVASFNDNNDGYSLGDDKIYCVSLVSQSTWPAETFCSRDNTPHKSETIKWCIYVTDNDVNKWYYNNDNGSWPYKTITVTPYNSSDTLEARCQQVKEYMNAPTSMLVNNNGDIIQRNYGLKNEGIVAVCDNVEAGLADIKSAFDNLSQLASDLYGVDPEACGSIDLYNQILCLVEQLTNVDQSSFDSDNHIVTYKKFLKRVIELSSQYLPVKQAYSNIYTDAEQAQYLASFYPNMDLTTESIENLVRYMKRKDAEDYNAILLEVDQFINVKFQKLLSTKDKLEEAVRDDSLVVQYTTGNAIESYLGTILEILINDVAQKTLIALSCINDHEQKINRYMGIISSEISSSLGSSINFDVCVKSKLSALNFFDHDLYKNWVDVFLTYGGQPFCYDPYYNMRNVTHPSYQVHPYMWNYVKKMQGDSLIGAGFKSKIVTDIIEGQSVELLKKYIGKYGQTIDTWKNYSNGAIDYSGYLTRWEMSEHTSPATGNFNKIVDFEGAFYPPALDDYLKNKNACISSVFDKMSKAKIQVLAADGISNDLSSYISVDESGKIVSNTFYNAVSAVVSKYCVTDTVRDCIDKAVNDTALSDLAKATVNTAIAEGVPYTFYENYYKHLNLPDTQCQYIAAQMKEYYDKIRDVTSSKALTAQYDIYKYGLDTYKNSYILFKKYDYTKFEQKEDLTYRAKRNALGQMWIRLAHTPLAFPAFSGENPQYFIHKPEMIGTAIFKLMKLKNGSIVYKDKYKTEISCINDDMQYFYDFEMSQDKNSIAYVLYNGDFYNKGSFYQQFELAWVATDVIAQYYDPYEDLEYLVFKNDSANNIDYIDFKPKTGLITNYRNIHDIADQDQLLAGVRYPSLVGYYVHDQSCIDFVYVYKKYTKHVDEDRNVTYSIITSGPDEVMPDADTKDEQDLALWNYNHDQCPAFFIVQVKNGVRVTTLPDTGSETIDVFRERSMYPYGHIVCVGYDQTQRHVVFAIATQNAKSFDKVTTETAVSCLNFNDNSEGAIIGDPIAHEINSHDILRQNVVLVSYKRKNKEISYVSCQDYNINADISYLPSYPGLSGEAKVYNKYPGNEYYNIELLGMSKDIEDFIKLVNPNPNPYFDISNDIEFGRIYEDYNKSEDKTFFMLQNPSLNTNMPQSKDDTYTTCIQYINGLSSQVSGVFILTYNLLNFNKQNRFTQRDLSSIELLIYNYNTLGKNPYYIGKLASLKPKNNIDEFDMYYNDEIIDTNNAESEIKTITDSEDSDINSDSDTDNIVSYRSKITVTGTYDKIGTRSVTDTNHIRNIDRFTARFDPETSQLTLKFYFDAAKEDVFVPEGCLRVMLYNTHDLTMFKYYHMLDAHGVVNCKYLSTLIDVIDEDYDSWGIVYNKDKYAKYNEISDLMRSYYIGPSGEKTYLNDIELSDYDYLSDIYILQGNKRLGFKYDEELRFDLSNDLYYYPTLNIHYPTRAVDFVAYGGVFSFISADNVAAMSDIFNHYNLFIIDLDSPEDVLSSIGQVDIPIIYNDVNDIRAYEDYLSVTVDNDEAGKAISSVANYLRYDSADPRAFRYVHFTSISTQNEPGGISKRLKTIQIPDDMWTNKTVNEFLLSCKSNLSNLCPMTSEELTSDFNSEYVSVIPTSDNCDISRQLKLYVNYRCNRDDGNKIDLYFNYFNWFDSPYVKIENGTQILLDTIEGTYLKLSPGEDGILDIVLQFKYYVGNVLYGYKNVKALSYRIFNLSDDKPKFLIQKVHQTSPGENEYNVGRGKVKFVIEADEIDLDERISNKDTDKADVNVYVDIKANKKMSKNASFCLEYSNAVLELVQPDIGIGYTIDRSKCSPGVVYIDVDDTSIGSYKILFRTKYDTNGLFKYANKKYLLDVIEPDISDEDGNGCDIEVEESYFSIIKKVDTVHLLTSSDNKDKRELIVADIFNNLVKLN